MGKGQEEKKEPAKGDVDTNDRKGKFRVLLNIPAVVFGKIGVFSPLPFLMNLAGRAGKVTEGVKDLPEPAGSFVVAFGKGLAVVFIAIAVLLAWSLIRAKDTVELQRGKLSTEIVTVETESVETETIVEAAKEENGGEEEEAEGREGGKKSVEDAGFHEDSRVSQNQEDSHVSHNEADDENIAGHESGGESVKTDDTGEAADVNSVKSAGYFEKYKSDFVADPGKPMIAVAVFDVGLSERLTGKVIKDLPSGFSLVFSTYDNNIKQHIKSAKAAGHEIWLLLPMATQEGKYVISDNYSISPDNTSEENIATVKKLLDSVEGHAGVFTEKMHSFKEKDEQTKVLLEQLLSYGLGLVESNPENTEIASAIIDIDADPVSLPYVQNNLWIDETLRTESINARLLALEQYASENGAALAIIRPYPISIETVGKWAEALAGKGMQLVPVSAIVGKQ